MSGAGDDDPILVLGATETQGGAVARALIRAGRPVRALIRDPRSAGAEALRRLGAVPVSGDFEDASSLRAAMAGCTALFSVQMAPGPHDRDAERRQASAILDTAKRADVRHVVHSSVSNTGDFRTMAGWAERWWEPNYWESKADVEAMVRDASFPVHTILRPAFMMENFLPPKAGFMFPDLRHAQLKTAIAPETKVAFVAADDIAAVAMAALASPDRFAGAALELAGDRCTMEEVATEIGRATGSPVRAKTRPPADLVAGGQHAGWVETQQWLNLVGYPARPSAMEAIGIPPTSFATWAAGHRDLIQIG